MVLSTVFVRRVGTLIGAHTVDPCLTTNPPLLPPCKDVFQVQHSSEVRTENTERVWSGGVSLRSNIFFKYHCHNTEHVLEESIPTTFVGDCRWGIWLRIGAL